MSDATDFLQKNLDDEVATDSPLSGVAAVTTDALVTGEAPAEPVAPAGGASEWTLRILLGGMMFLLLLCGLFILIAS